MIHTYQARFKLPIHVVDTTVMELVANCLDWAKHRRRKAAAKTHMRLNLQSLLPQFVIVDTAGEHDNQRAREVCAGSVAVKSLCLTRVMWTLSICVIWGKDRSIGSLEPRKI